MVHISPRMKFAVRLTANFRTGVPTNYFHIITVLYKARQHQKSLTLHKEKSTILQKFTYKNIYI